MSWLEFLAAIIPSLGWPIAIVLVAGLFASELVKLLARLHKFGPNGLELFPPTVNQSALDFEGNSQLSGVLLEDLTDPVAIKFENKTIG